MSRRREATDLARALALSTQPTAASSSTSLRDSSPPITPLPTKLIPQKQSAGQSGGGGFMDQYHQQLQQAQSYYQQQNREILAPPSHSSRNTYVRRPDNDPHVSRAPAQQTSHGRSHQSNLTSSRSSNSHISDSNRSIPGAILLPDSGYHYPLNSHDLEPYPARRDFPSITSSTLNSVANRTAQVQALSSSGGKSSLSGDSGTQFCPPPAQPRKSPLQSTIYSTSSTVQTITNQSIKTPQTASTRSSILPSGPASATSHRSSVINTAPPITPVSSDSRIVSSSISATTPALEPTFTTTVNAITRQPTAPGTVGNGKVRPSMATADDIVADSEGEDDAVDIVQGTQDGVIHGSKPRNPEYDIGGLRTGLITPPISDSNASSRQSASVVASVLPAQVSAAKPASSAINVTPLAVAQDASGSRLDLPSAPTSTRPKPKRRVKPMTDSPLVANPVVLEIAAPTTSLLPPPPSEMGAVAQLSGDVQQTSSAPAFPDNDATKKTLKTYGSKNKDIGASAKANGDRTVNANAKKQAAKTSDESTLKVGPSKRRTIVGSDSELSDSGRGDGQGQQRNKLSEPGAGHGAERVAGGEDASERGVKRSSKKRAIFASDDETEEEQLHTPDSKRKRADLNEEQPQHPPTKKTGRPRDSSVDPLDMDVDNGMSGKGARMEVSIDLSPSNSVKDLITATRAGPDVEKPISTKTKSPNKVHFIDVDGEEPASKPTVSKKSKSAPRLDDAYDDYPEEVAPVNDDDDQDDFVPTGGKKAKAKAKTAKAKKAAVAKEKVVKGKKASQAKGKKGKVADVVEEPVEQPGPGPEERLSESNLPIASANASNAVTENETVPSSIVAEVVQVAPVVVSKAKAKKTAAAAKKASKAAKSEEFIPDDAMAVDQPEPVAIIDKAGQPAKLPVEATVIEDVAEVGQPSPGTQAKKASTGKKNVVLSDDEEIAEKEVPAAVAHVPALAASKVLQPKTSLAVNSPANAKLEPSFVVDKNGNVKEFRTCRTDLPKVVQTTGGVKRMGFSRRSAIPSLHKSIKAPPKRLPPPPKKPSRKKEDSDDDSDELDENGKKKIRPGDPEWYMMDVD